MYFCIFAAEKKREIEKMAHFIHRIAIVCAAILLAAAPAWGEKFVFTTIWTAQAQFAGYYVAKEKGFYKELGLDVVIQHPSLTSSASNRLKTDQCDAELVRDGC